jgi:predicted metal-dependent enzyme (double-stranded beta helix superfamily)
VRILIDGLRSVVATGTIGEPEIAKMEKLVRNAIPRLQATCLCNKPVPPGRYLCYKDPQFGFVIMLMVWGPGDKTAIHDHGTWGVEAILKNSLKVTTYTECEVSPQPVDSMVVSAGMVMNNTPPDRDVHRVEHFAGDCALSLHIYGREMTGNRSFVSGEGYKVCSLETKCLGQEFALPDFSFYQMDGRSAKAL